MCRRAKSLSGAFDPRARQHALVLFYDSLDASSGAVRYQNGLTPANECFFSACDGLFTNYWWTKAQLQQTAALAAERRHDVYVGVDCFARAPQNFALPYQPGPGCAPGVRLVREAGLSLALFAPGWSFECGDAKGREGDAARECDAQFWDALGVQRLFR